MYATLLYTPLVYRYTALNYNHEGKLIGYRWLWRVDDTFRGEAAAAGGSCLQFPSPHTAKHAVALCSLFRYPLIFSLVSLLSSHPPTSNLLIFFSASLSLSLSLSLPFSVFLCCSLSFVHLYIYILSSFSLTPIFLGPRSLATFADAFWQSSTNLNSLRPFSKLIW